MGASIYLGKVLSAGTKGCNIIVPTTAAIDPDAQAFLTAAGITDATISSAINTLVVDLKGYNVWTKMQALYPFVGGTATTHKWNLKDPRDLDAAFRLQFFGDITHSSNGIIGGGVTNYVNTFCNPLNNLTSNSIHVSFYSRTNIDALMNDMGVSDLTGKEIIVFPRYAINSSGFGVQNTAASRLSPTVTDSRGLFIINRTSSNVQNVWKNTTKLATETQNSVTRPNGDIWITAWNNLTNTNFPYRSTRQQAFASIGDGLTDTEAANFYTAVQAFQTTLGRQVGTPIPYTSFPLDTYTGAEVAYSLRRLRTAYTGNLIRVRRSSDNTEMDFGYNTNNVLDTASLLTFCGVGNGFVTTWYDQSGNANNGTQTTAINQPQIVSSGVMVTVNGNNSMSFDGSNDSFNLTSTITAAASNFNTFVGKRDAIARALFGLANGASGTGYFWGLGTDNFAYLQAKTTGYNSSGSNLDTTQLLLTGLNNAGTMSMFKNGNTLASSFTALALNMGISTIGFYSNNAAVANCNLQEIVFYNSNQSTNRTGIESNINSFYTIY